MVCVCVCVCAVCVRVCSSCVSQDAAFEGTKWCEYDYGNLNLLDLESKLPSARRHTRTTPTHTWRHDICKQILIHWRVTEEGRRGSRGPKQRAKAEGESKDWDLHAIRKRSMCSALFHPHLSSLCISPHHLHLFSAFYPPPPPPPPPPHFSIPLYLP